MQLIYSSLKNIIILTVQLINGNETDMTQEQETIHKGSNYKS